VGGRPGFPATAGRTATSNGNGEAHIVDPIRPGVAELDVVLLALFPALLWGFEPIVSKRGMNAGGRSLQAAVTAVAVSSVLYWSALLLVDGPANLTRSLDPASVGVFVLAGVVGTAFGRLGMFVGIRRVGASISNAAINARPLFATVVALVWLGEPIGPLVGVGIVVLVAGLVLLTVSKGGDVRGWEPRYLLVPLSAAVAFAVGNVVRRFGLTTTGVSVLQAVTINETTALVVLGGYVLLRNREALTGPPRGTYGFFVGSGLLTAVALLSMFAAFDRGPVAVVDPITAVSPLFTTFFAYFLLRDVERVTRGIVAGVGLVVAGVALVVGGGPLLAVFG